MIQTVVCDFNVRAWKKGEEAHSVHSSQWRDFNMASWACRFPRWACVQEGGRKDGNKGCYPIKSYIARDASYLNWSHEIAFSLTLLLIILPPFTPHSSPWSCQVAVCITLQDKHNLNTRFSNSLTSQSSEAPGNQPSTYATSFSIYC